MKILTVQRLRAPVVSIDSGGHRDRFFERRDALVESHVHLVPPIARRIAGMLPPSFDLDDLMGTGYMALLHAATRYRPREHGGTPFSAFARPRIRGAMLDSVRRRHWEENTRPSIDDTPEPADERACAIIDAIDERRLRERVFHAVAGVPRGARDRGGRFLNLAELVGIALGLPTSVPLHEHGPALKALRRRLQEPAA